MRKKPHRETERKSGSRSTGLVVLGMHRSGTSLLANLLGRLGASYGGPLIQAHVDNPGGYWEHAEIVSIHDDFLASRGRSWHDPSLPTATAHSKRQPQSERGLDCERFSSGTSRPRGSGC